MSERPRMPSATSSDLEAAERLAEAHGLRALGERPPLRDYVSELWARRGFLWTLSLGQSTVQNEGNRLGQLWSVLNPALLILTYFLIFGLLIPTRGGITNFIGFLSIGVVTFGYLSSAVTRGAKSVTSNVQLVRALRFPRAMLPLSVVLSEFMATIPAFVLIVGVMLITREKPSWTWLMLPVAVLILTGILAGLALLLARLVNISKDVDNLIPVSIRLLRYISGVFFSIQHYASRFGGVVQIGLEYSPFALPLTIVREALMKEFPIHWIHWAVCAIWAIVLFVGGLVVFWRDEAKYGRG